MNFSVLHLLFFLQLFQEISTYFTINLTHPIRIPNRNSSSIIFVEHLTATAILIHQSNGKFTAVDNNFNQIKSFTGIHPNNYSLILIFPKIFISQSRTGFIAVTADGLMYIFQLEFKKQYTNTSSWPIVHVFSYAHYDLINQYKKSWYVLVTEKSIDTFNVQYKIGNLYNLTLARPTSKFLGCQQEVDSTLFMLYCFTNSMQIFLFNLSYAALSPPLWTNSVNQSFYKHNSQISKLILKENLLFIHDSLMKLTVLNLNKNNQIVSFDIILENLSFFDVFYFNSYFYLIIKSDFIKFQYDSISLKLKRLSLLRII